MIRPNTCWPRLAAEPFRHSDDLNPDPFESPRGGVHHSMQRPLEDGLRTTEGVERPVVQVWCRTVDPGRVPDVELERLPGGSGDGYRTLGVACPDWGSQGPIALEPRDRVDGRD